MIRINFNSNKCTGCGYCVEIAPDRWLIDESDGKCKLVDASTKKGFSTVITTDDEYYANMEAAQSCPVKAIRIEKY